MFDYPVPGVTSKITGYSVKIKYITGVSLIEVVIAMLILSVGLLGIGSFQASVTRSSVNALQRTEAVINAQSKIEALRFSDATEITSGTDAIPSGNTEFSRQWQTNILNKENIEITSIVNWPDLEQSTKSGKLQSSENTRIAVGSVISTQTYTDSSIWFKSANKNFVTIYLGPGSNNIAKTMHHHRNR